MNYLTANLQQRAFVWKEYQDVQRPDPCWQDDLITNFGQTANLLWQSRSLDSWKRKINFHYSIIIMQVTDDYKDVLYVNHENQS